MAHDNASEQSSSSGNPLANPALLRSPQTIYPGIRAAGPMDLGGRAVLISRRADVMAVLADPVLFSSGVGVTQTGADRPLIPLQLDPPDHRKYRRILDPLFSLPRMREMEGAITDLARSLIEPLAAKEEVDFVQEFSLLFPSQVVLTMLGLPLDDLPYFLSLKDGFVRPESITGHSREHPDSVALLKRTANAIYAYFEIAIAQKRANPCDDLISGFLETEIDGERLSDNDILDVCFLLLIAALDTVSASLDCIFLHLANEPERRRAIVEDPSLVTTAAEELLRWESPVIMVARIATDDTEISGCPVRKGQVITALLGAANTDEDDLPDANVVRLDRESNRHLAYGRGIHHCLGVHLARIELRVALREWHARIPDYGVPSDFEPTFNTSIRSLASLPLRLGPQA